MPVSFEVVSDEGELHGPAPKEDALSKERSGGDWLPVHFLCFLGVSPFAGVFVAAFGAYGCGLFEGSGFVGGSDLDGEASILFDVADGALCAVGWSDFDHGVCSILMTGVGLVGLAKMVTVALIAGISTAGSKVSGPG